jgi:hypothetical protein
VSCVRLDCVVVRYLAFVHLAESASPTRVWRARRYCLHQLVCVSTASSTMMSSNENPAVTTTADWHNRELIEVYHWISAWNINWALYLLRPCFGREAMHQQNLLHHWKTPNFVDYPWLRDFYSLIWLMYFTSSNSHYFRTSGHELGCAQACFLSERLR